MALLSKVVPLNVRFGLGYKKFTNVKVPKTRHNTP